jgi:hypothetical protein
MLNSCLVQTRNLLLLLLLLLLFIIIIYYFCVLIRNPDFQLFQSPFDHPDLIFSDSSVQLFKINEELENYLGSDIIEIIHKTDPRICNAALTNSVSYLAVMGLWLITKFIVLFD